MPQVRLGERSDRQDGDRIPRSRALEARCRGPCKTSRLKCEPRPSGVSPGSDRLLGPPMTRSRIIAENDPERKVRIAALDALSVGWPEDPSLYPLLLRRLKVVSDRRNMPTLAGRSAVWILRLLRTFPALLDALSAGRLDSSQVDSGRTRKARGRGPARRCRNLARVARIRARRTERRDVRPWRRFVRSTPTRPKLRLSIEPLAAMLRDSPSVTSRQQAAFRLMRFGPSAAAAVATHVREPRRAGTLMAGEKASCYPRLELGPAATSGSA